ncbi:RNA-binding protein 26 [Pelomyxa schiedti]|nr:RNA-binding protein 26 [Pelomyxa schiedti]
MDVSPEIRLDARTEDPQLRPELTKVPPDMTDFLTPEMGIIPGAWRGEVKPPPLWAKMKGPKECLKEIKEETVGLIATQTALKEVTSSKCSPDGEVRFLTLTSKDKHSASLEPPIILSQASTTRESILRMWKDTAMHPTTSLQNNYPLSLRAFLCHLCTAKGLCVFGMGRREWSESKDIPYQIQPPSEQVSLPIPYAWQASNSCISTPAPILTQPQMYTPPIPEPEYRREFTVPPSNCSTSGFQLDVHLPQSAGVPHSTTEAQHNSSTQDQPPQNGSLEWESPTRAFVTPETTPFIIPSPAAPTTVYSSSKTISSSQLQNRNPMQNATQPQGYKRWPPKDHREWKSATKTGALKVVGIPKHLNRIELLNEHFSKFGTILNLQVKPQSNRAFVQFSTHEEAMAAIQSPDAVCGNRFIQVFWANFGHVDQHASADDAKRKTVPPTVQIPVQPTPNKGQIHSYKPGQLNNNVPNMKGENQIPAIDKPTAPNNPSAQPPPSTVLAPKQAPSVQLSTLSNKLAEYKKMVEAVEKKKDLLDPSEQAQLMQSLAAVHKSLLSALAAKQASPFAKSGGITPSTLADTTQHGQKRPPRVTYSAIPPITAADRPKYCPQPKRPRNTGIAPPQSANAKMCNSIEVSYSELKQQVDALKQQALKLGLDPLALKPISHISRLPSTEPPLSQFPAHSAAVKFYNLPLHLQTESALKPILQQFGPIRDIRIETDTTGISSTVNFETQAAADRALHLGIPGESVKVSPGEPSTDTPAHGSHAPPPIQDQQDDVSTTTNAEGYTVQVYQSGTSENQFYGGNEYQDTDSPERSWKHS